MARLYATFDDVTLAYEGTIPDSDRPRVEALLLRASSRLTRIVPSVPLRLASGDLEAELPAGLVVEAVLRVYRNPEGVTAEEIGPFHKQFNARAIAAEIQFDEAEVHSYLDPIPNYTRPAIRVGLPTRAQTLTLVGGQDWPAPPQNPVDTGALSDVCLAVLS